MHEETNSPHLAEAPEAGDEADVIDINDPLSLEDPINPDEAILALEAERDELKDRLMRALAEAENQRKRGERDRRDAEAYGGSKLARDILPVFDNLNRAVAAVTDAQREAASSLIEGVELTLRELVSAFGRHKIEMIAPQKGDRFDPKLHQAMFEAPVPDVAKDHVIDTMTVGFTIADRLLRAAQVGVSSNPNDVVKDDEAPVQED